MTPRLKPAASDQPFLRRLVMVVVAVALIAFLYQTKDLLLLAFGAMLGAVLLCASTDLIVRNTPLRRGPALGLSVLLVLGFFALIGWLFGRETFARPSSCGRRCPRIGQSCRRGSQPIRSDACC